MTSVGAADHMQRAPDGLLRFDVRRDLAAVIELLELGFGDDLEARDRRWLKDLAALSAAGPLMNVLLHIIPGAVDGLGGFVWYDAGRLIANASLLRAGPDTWVIANVVTHPSYRRQGIAGRLMDSALDVARARGARRIQLQVRDTNDAAKTLYTGLGFGPIGSSTLYRLPSSAALAPSSEDGRTRTGAGADDVAPIVTVRPWRSPGDARTTRLLARAGEIGRAGPPSLVRGTARRGRLKGRLDDWLHSRTRHRLAVSTDGEHRALAVVDAYEYGNAHRLDIVVDPSWRGRVEPQIVRACLDRLIGVPPAAVETDATGQDGPLRAALEAAGFVPVRTLERLELWLGGR